MVLVIACLTSPPAGAKAPDGRRLFESHCAPCHGANGTGDGPDARLFTPPPRDLHDGVLTRYGTDELVRRVRQGRLLALTRDPHALDEQLRRTDAMMAYLPRMAAANWPAARRGRALYESNCADCHGGAGVPAAAADAPPDLTTAAVQDTLDRPAVRHTRPNMRTLAPTPTPAQGTDLLAFVGLLSPGYTLYTRHCASCHGDDGTPVTVVPTGGRRPQVRIDRAYLAATRPQEVETAIWHMLDATTPQMPHFDTTLDDGQLRAIVEYLRTQDGR